MRRVTRFRYKRVAQQRSPNGLNTPASDCRGSDKTQRNPVRRVYGRAKWLIGALPVRTDPVRTEPPAVPIETKKQKSSSHLKHSRTKSAGLIGSLNRLCQKVCIIAAAALMTACNGSLLFMKDQEPPAKYVDARAISFGMQRSIEDSGLFRHVVYSKKPSADAVELARSYGSHVNDRLHVYIEGDGVAWRSRFIISRDPTSRNVLMLDLMAMDPAHSLYLGRPCYLGQADDTDCESTLWTYERFSETVVDSMVAAIRARAGKSDYIKSARDIVLFGHSGGAALAMLIAARLPQVSAVVTVAGNLDTKAWVKHHGYTPLFGSLDPARQPPLSSRVRQLHLVGERDSVIPPELVKGSIDRQPAASVWRFDDYTHNCCWKQQWPLVLNWVRTGVSPVFSSAL